MCSSVYLLVACFSPALQSSFPDGAEIYSKVIYGIQGFYLQRRLTCCWACMDIYLNVLEYFLTVLITNVS